jgi:spermidine synthase
MAKGFASPKARVVISDGCEYLKQHSNEFDVIIIDSSDPEGEFDHKRSISFIRFYFLGPAGALFEEPFYSLMKSALKQPSGIICCQGECIWLDLPLIKKLMTIGRHLFPSVAYANVSTPTYPCGALGFVVCGLDEVKKFSFFT